MSELHLVNLSEVNKQILDIQRAVSTGGSPAEIHGEGIVLLKNYSQGSTNSGKPKYTGTIANIDETKFNVWSNSSAFEYLYKLPITSQSHVVWIGYSLSKYGLVINTMKSIDGFNPDAFEYHKYSAKQKAAEFVSVLKMSGISENAMSVIRAVYHMDYNDIVSKRIVREYAAYSHHDNCATGLLAHTTKCILLYSGIKSSYSFLTDETTNDLMVISLALHDIGKIYEMHDGVYQDYSFITHRGLGIEHLLPYKHMIVELYNEEFFYMICSVILQHHGEYGENPRTVYAMIVHMIDDLEAQLTSIDNLLQNGEITRDSAGAKIKYNGTYLNILQKMP